jgi:hypothetical protein
MESHRVAIRVRSVELAATLVNAALADAMRRTPRPIEDNLAEAARVPGTDATYGEFAPWTSTQFRTFLQGVTKDRLGAAFTFGALTAAGRGCRDAVGRRGPESRNGKHPTHLVVANGRLVESVPKTKAGVRTVALSAPVPSALREWEARQRRDRMANRLVWPNSGYVFTREDGRPSTRTGCGSCCG